MSQGKSVGVTPNLCGEEKALTSSHPRIDDPDDGEMHFVGYARLGKRVYKAPCVVAFSTHTQLGGRIKELAFQVQNFSRSLEAAMQIPQSIRRPSRLSSKPEERLKRSITV